MSPTNDDLSGPLTWERQSIFSRDYFLKGRSGELANIGWPNVLSFRAEGRADGRTYILTRKGVFRPEVSVLRTPYEEKVAVMQLAGQGGRLEFSDGSRYTMVRPSILKLIWSFQDENGNEVASFTVPAFKKRMCEARVDGGMHRERQLLLLLIGWYVIVPKLDQRGGA